MNKNKLSYLLIAGLVIIPATPALAEELPEDPIIEEPAPEPEPLPEQKIEPVEQTTDEAGTWSVVDADGNVVNAILCQQSVCGEGGELSKPDMFCDGCTVHFQQPGHAGYRDASSQGGPSVTYERETETHVIESKGTREDGSDYGTTIKMKDGKTLSASDTSIFRETTTDEKVVEAKVNVYSVRQLSDRNAETELKEIEADVKLSAENVDKVLEYENTEELINSLPSEAEQIIDEDTNQLISPSVRESIMNVVNKIVSFFSSLIGGNDV